MFDISTIKKMFSRLYLENQFKHWIKQDKKGSFQGWIIEEPQTKKHYLIKQMLYQHDSTGEYSKEEISDDSFLSYQQQQQQRCEPHKEVSICCDESDQDYKKDVCFGQYLIKLSEKHNFELYSQYHKTNFRYQDKIPDKFKLFQLFKSIIIQKNIKKSQFSSDTVFDCKSQKQNIAKSLGTKIRAILDNNKTDQKLLQIFDKYNGSGVKIHTVSNPKGCSVQKPKLFLLSTIKNISDLIVQASTQINKI